MKKKNSKKVFLKNQKIVKTKEIFPKNQVYQNLHQNQNLNLNPNPKKKMPKKLHQKKILK